MLVIKSDSENEALLLDSKISDEKGSPASTNRLQFSTLWEGRRKEESRDGETSDEEKKKENIVFTP